MHPFLYQLMIIILCCVKEERGRKEESTPTKCYLILNYVEHAKHVQFFTFLISYAFTLQIHILDKQKNIAKTKWKWTFRGTEKVTMEHAKNMFMCGNNHNKRQSSTVAKICIDKRHTDDEITQQDKIIIEHATWKNKQTWNSNDVTMTDDDYDTQSSFFNFSSLNTYNFVRKKSEFFVIRVR